MAYTGLAYIADAAKSIASDLISSVYHQRCKIGWGPEGTANDTDTAAGKGLPVQIMPGTVGGLSIFHLVAAASTNATNVKASATQLYTVHGFNKALYPVKVAFHNTAGTPTAGTGVVMTFVMQSGAPTPPLIAPQGLAFGAGLAITIVQANSLLDNVTTAVADGDCVISLGYK